MQGLEASPGDSGRGVAGPLVHLADTGLLSVSSVSQGGAGEQG